MGFRPRSKLLQRGTGHHFPKPFNVEEDETSGELLAQPLHTEYQAYCILKKAVYPFTLPYHQPIDSTRISLDFLGTSRHELIDVFRSPRKERVEPEIEGAVLPPIAAEIFTELEITDLKAEHETYLDRAADSEYLGLTEEEFVILTKQSFVSKRYWDKETKAVHTQEEYHAKIGVKPVHVYYGYGSEGDMLSADESVELGLTFVKNQFLRRTGLEYLDLVELLRTQCLNPNIPQGMNLRILEGIAFSYRYLQTKIVKDAKDNKAKYAELVQFLNKPQSVLPGLAFFFTSDPCNPKKEEYALKISDLEKWVHCFFESIGKIIVLENGISCIDGNLIPPGDKFNNVRLKFEKCRITVENGDVSKPFGEIKNDTGLIIKLEDIPGNLDYLTDWTFIGSRGERGMIVKMGDAYSLVSEKTHLPFSFGQVDTCNLDSVRLIHLDGTPITVEEYDHIHRFIRLWRKLGWTIFETDKALVGLGNVLEAEIDPDSKIVKDYEEVFNEVSEECGDCKDDKKDEDYECAEIRKASKISFDINPYFLHELVAVKKQMESSGLELVKLLVFWTDIGIIGDQALYKRLFLTHNLVAMDSVFKPDQNGLYLTPPGKITEHIPALMAALNFSADEVSSILSYSGMDDELSLANVSLLYRYRLLATLVGLKVSDFLGVLPIFGDPFGNAATSLKFLERWRKMEAAGFDAHQLNFILRNQDYSQKPLSPPKKSLVQLAKTLYDGLNSIDQAHKDVKPNEEITAEIVQGKCAMLFDRAIAEQIMGILEGTSTFTTNAPNLPLIIPPTLSRKLGSDADSETFRITGILTASEETDFNNSNGSQEWGRALARIQKQQEKLLKEVLADIIAAESAKTPQRKDEVNENVNILKAGDIPLDKNAAAGASLETAPEKRMAFMSIFMPYLRGELTRRFISETLSGLVGLNRDQTEILVMEILTCGPMAISLYTAFAEVKESAKPTALDWNGYFIPAKADPLLFIVRNSNTKPILTLDGQVLDFEAQEDPTNEWWSPMQKLIPGKLYQFKLTGLDSKDLFFKTIASSIMAIPGSQLLPDFATTSCEPALTALKKAALWVSGFNLSADELRFLQANAGDFGNLDFNKMTLEHWLRLDGYTRLRNSLPQGKIDILEFLQWTQKAVLGADLPSKISELTLWNRDRIGNLIDSNGFDLNRPTAFLNEKNLLKVQKALTVADAIGMETHLLFDWAKPTSNFKKCRIVADSIQLAIRARYNQTDWEALIKPLNDKLRENQKKALIAYLLQQPDLINWNVTDADGLFEYFLIDVQMDACMETSRIKQAISSVQLFVQRCFLGLEEDRNGITPNTLDRGRLTWMDRFRVWEANRKVFLYPENWIESNLRDDKSPFFKELESELLQKDINKQNVEDALKTYLYKVDEVANMEVVGVHIEEKKKLHVFSRTRNAPFMFFYRYLDIAARNWYPWEKMQLDIPSYDMEDLKEIIYKNPATHSPNPDYKKITGNGSYLTPVIWNDRLLIFFPQFMKKSKSGEDITGSKSIRELSEDSTDTSKPIEYWEIKMAWSEYRNGKWTQKQLSKDAIYDIPAPDHFWKAFNNASKAAVKADAANKEVTDKFNIYDAKLKRRNLTAGNSSQFPLAVNEMFMAFDQWNEAKTNATAANNAKTKADDALGPLFPPSPGSDISKYEFVPVMSDVDNLLGIKIYYDNDQSEIGTFEFNGSNITIDITDSYSHNNLVDVSKFHHKAALIKSLQISDEVNDHSFRDATTTYYMSPDKTIKFHHSDAHKLLGMINAQKLEPLFKFPIHGIDHNPDKDDVFGGYDQDADALTPNIYHELKRPYSIYNWELFFHTPMMLADALSKSQQFEEAMKWYHYVFNPVAEGPGDNRFWQFSPFKDMDAKHILDHIFNTLKPNESDDDINEWRGNPFKPHLVARSRPVAYMKWVVMKYVDNLVAWGDYLFRQDTIESINQATQLYILAGHILGPRPQMIPKRGKIKPQTYNSLLDKWDAFSNAMVELELAAPFSNQTTFPIGIGKGVFGFANVFGFASSLYFCIPNNPKLIGYWDTLADRLFKIRHCENIDGIVRKLPLFEPPIDPGLLVKAAAQGLSIASVLNDLNSPMPNYRFYYLLQKALELCGELKSLGSAMLSALEKKDGESLSLIRARHESTMHGLVMEIKKQQLDEANKALDGLRQNRKSPEHRMKYYLQLVGEDIGKVPGTGSEFSELANTIEAPVDESGLKLIKNEKEDMEKAQAAAEWQIGIGIAESLAGVLSVIPNAAIDFKPFGMGAGATFGGSNLSSATSAVARGLQIFANQLTFQSTSSGKKGTFQRGLQDRVMQANAAGYEIKQIDKQILSQQIRIGIANSEITNQQKQIENASEIEEFLKDKYTNDELYVWMKGNLSTLYHQVYGLAFELAKKAEKVYCFERGLESSKFIQAGYWDAGYGGLLSGEKLYLDLKRLEAAHQENRGYDFEITKHISLRQIAPMSLLQLKAIGKCEFAIPEVLFDMDYPGHYKRRIKSVSISVPCVSGPYMGLNATLRLLENKFRVSPIAKDLKGYSEKTEENDERFLRFNIPITSIAASSGQNDSGMFELNFKDERYLPFEGAGAISRWSLELPSAFRQFDYETISDAIVHIRYTANAGGDRLQGYASDSVVAFAKKAEELAQQEGLFVLLDLKHDFPDAWHKAMQSDLGNRVLSIKNVKDFLPYYSKFKNGGKPYTIKLTGVDLVATSSTKGQPGTPKELEGVSFSQGGAAIALNPTGVIGI